MWLKGGELGPIPEILWIAGRTSVHPAQCFLQNLPPLRLVETLPGEILNQPMDCECWLLRTVVCLLARDEGIGVEIGERIIGVEVFTGPRASRRALQALLSMRAVGFRLLLFLMLRRPEGPSRSMNCTGSPPSGRQ